MRPAAVPFALLLSGCTAVYGGYSAGRPDYAVLPNGRSLVGGTLGAEAWPAEARHAGYTEFQVRANGEEDLSVVEWVGGGRLSLVQTDDLRLGLEADFGLAQADLDRFRNSNELVTAATGVFARARLVDRVWILGSIGVRAYWDVTDPTTCRDGSTSPSTGSGTCSHHGGIAFANDELGDGVGIDYFLGLLIEF